ncbi:hypothetical protein [Phenylobacterium sp.]|uniref:hypothetical protein n=1 Tax=Phenylobacterium sp. TaxID=1871053 RepID=UPI00289F5DE1|nr:hypothetical protein [Phenylobacterium sp.]
MGCAASAVLLAGCISNPFAQAKVDPNSAVAEDVARMARESRSYPSFADIPPPPARQRPVGSWGKAADQLEVAGAQLDRDTAPNTWTLSGTDRFVARARAQAGPDIGTDASTTPSSEAFAKELRERATPPPSPR